MFDLREKNINGLLCGQHSGPVLAVAAAGHTLYSASEDRSVAVWDTRMPLQELCKLKVRVPLVVDI